MEVSALLMLLTQMIGDVADDKDVVLPPDSPAAIGDGSPVPNRYRIGNRKLVRRAAQYRADKAQAASAAAEAHIHNAEELAELQTTAHLPHHTAFRPHPTGLPQPHLW